MKTFFNLTGAYEGLKVRRLARFGRVVLDRVINDGAPYWFVAIRNFDETRDWPLIRSFSTSWGKGTWRFVRLTDAERCFERLKLIPEYIADELKAENNRRKNSERMRAIHDSGQVIPKTRSIEILP